MLRGLLNAAIETAKMIKGKASFLDIFMSLMTTLPKAIMDAIGYGKLNSVEKLDEALAELDYRTGLDAGALDLIADLPADKEELLFDHLKGMAEILGKHKLKVPGYVVDDQTIPTE